VTSFASVLFMDPVEVDERRSFGELGMDSVLAVEWIRDINQAYGIRIEATAIYDHSDIRAMARLVHDHLGGAFAPAPAVQPDAAPMTLGLDQILKQVRDGILSVEEAERLLGRG
jgi:acyl carrier protein